MTFSGSDISLPEEEDEEEEEEEDDDLVVFEVLLGTGGERLLVTGRSFLEELSLGTRSGEACSRDGLLSLLDPLEDCV